MDERHHWIHDLIGAIPDGWLLTSLRTVSPGTITVEDFDSRISVSIALAAPGIDKLKRILAALPDLRTEGESDEGR